METGISIDKRVFKTEFLVYHDVRGFVIREVEDIKNIAASDSGRRFKTSCSAEFDRPSDGELAWICSSCGVFVLSSFLVGMHVPPLEAMVRGGAVVVTCCLVGFRIAGKRL